MTKEMKAIIDDFLDNFKNLDIVKNYLMIKRKLKNDEKFLNLKNQKKNLQKELALSINSDNYSIVKEKFLQVENEYNNYPLYLNYLSYEQEVKSLLKEIEIFLK